MIGAMADDSEESSLESNKRKRTKLGLTVNVTGAPVNAQNLSVGPGGHALVGNIIKVEVTTSNREEDLEKLCEQTEERIEKSCLHGFVKTTAFYDAVKELNNGNAVILLGRPGDGKTELGYQLLGHFKEEKKMKALELKQPEDWKCVDTNERQIIFIDDMFGRRKDDWLDVLKQCTAEKQAEKAEQAEQAEKAEKGEKGEKGAVKFVITSQPHLYRSGSHGPFITAVPTIEIFGLSQKEKEFILTKFSSHNSADALTPDQITQAAQKAPPLGFPEACWTFFQERKKGKKLGLEFFENPLKYQKQLLNEMMEREEERKDDSLQVLVLAMLQGGQLIPNNETLKQMSSEKRSLAEEYSNDKHLNAGKIRQTAIKLEDRYFRAEGSQHGKNGEEKTPEKEMFTFLHQSIYELVFIHVLESYPEESVKLAPFELIRRYVRTKHPTGDDDTRKINEKWLLDRLTSELLTGNLSALSHPSLQEDKEFEAHFAEDFCKMEENVSKLLELPAPVAYLDVCLDDYTMIFDKNTPLSFEHMTAGQRVKSVKETTNCFCHIVSQGLTTMASTILKQATRNVKDATDLNEALVYACAAKDLELCMLLIQKGAKPHIDAAQAACGKDDNEKIVELLLAIGIRNSSDKKSKKKEPKEIYACSRIAVQHGHANMLEGIIKKWPKILKPKLEDLYYTCLLQCHGRYVDHSAVGNRRSKEVFDVLRQFVPKTPVHSSRDLLIAAAHRSWSIGETLLAEGAAINCQHGEEKYTPLHVALRYGGTEVVQELLKKGPSKSLDIPDVQGRRPLHWLGIELGKQIRSGYQSRTDHLMKVLETVLREHNPAVEMSDLLSKPDNKGHTPLHYIFGEMEEEDIFLVLLERRSAESYDKKTISTNLCKMVELLQDNVVDASSTRDGQKRTLLHTYVGSPYCQQEVLQSLLHFYRDINMEDEAKRTTLHVYMSQGMVTPDTVDFFLNNGADVDCTDEDGMTPWMHYTMRVDVRKDIVGKFLDKNINLALTDKNKRTILHLYCSSENAKIDLLTEMIDKGADVKARDSQGRTALMTLCDAGNVPTLVVKTLIKRGCPMNDQDSQGKTALIWLCSNPIGFKEEVLKVLLRKAADPDIMEQSSQTPLRAYVSSQPKVEGRVITLLLEHMKRADVPDANGCTVLHLLAASGCATEENVSALVEAKKHQISPVAVDKNKCTALHLACSHRPKLEVIKKLISHMPKPDKEDKEGKSALHVTTDKKDSNGQTALHVYHSGWWPVEKAVVESLLDAGIEVNQKDKKGRTALHLYFQTARQVNMDIDQDVVFCHMKRGFDPSSTDKTGSPALMCSIL